MALTDVESFNFLFKMMWDSVGPLDERCRLNILDTVCFKDGLPHRWVFTSEKTGEVLKKNSTRLNVKEMVRAFKHRAHVLHGRKPRGFQNKIATIYYYESVTKLSFQLVDEDELRQILGSGDQIVEICAVQVYIGGYEISGCGMFQYRMNAVGFKGLAGETMEINSMPTNLYQVQSIDTIYGQAFEESEEDRRKRDMYAEILPIPSKKKVTTAHHNMLHSVAKRIAGYMEMETFARVVRAEFLFIFNSSWIPFVACARGVVLNDPPPETLHNRDKLFFFSDTSPVLSYGLHRLGVPASTVMMHTMRGANASSASASASALNSAQDAAYGSSNGGLPLLQVQTGAQSGVAPAGGAGQLQEAGKAGQVMHVRSTSTGFMPSTTASGLLVQTNSMPLMAPGNNGGAVGGGELPGENAQFPGILRRQTDSGPHNSSGSGMYQPNVRRFGPGPGQAEASAIALEMQQQLESPDDDDEYRVRNDTLTTMDIPRPLAGVPKSMATKYDQDVSTMMQNVAEGSLGQRRATSSGMGTSGRRQSSVGTGTSRPGGATQQRSFSIAPANLNVNTAAAPVVGEGDGYASGIASPTSGGLVHGVRRPKSANQALLVDHKRRKDDFGNKSPPKGQSSNFPPNQLRQSQSSFDVATESSLRKRSHIDITNLYADVNATNPCYVGDKINKYVVTHNKHHDLHVVAAHGALNARNKAHDYIMGDKDGTNNDLADPSLIDATGLVYGNIMRGIGKPDDILTLKTRRPISAPHALRKPQQPKAEDMLRKLVGPDGELELRHTTADVRILKLLAAADHQQREAAKAGVERKLPKQAGKFCLGSYCALFKDYASDALDNRESLLTCMFNHHDGGSTAEAGTARGAEKDEQNAKINKMLSKIRQDIHGKGKGGVIVDGDSDEEFEGMHESAPSKGPGQQMDATRLKEEQVNAEYVLHPNNIVTGKDGNLYYANKDTFHSMNCPNQIPYKSIVLANYEAKLLRNATNTSRFGENSVEGGIASTAELDSSAELMSPAASPSKGTGAPNLSGSATSAPGGGGPLSHSTSSGGRRQSTPAVGGPGGLGGFESQGDKSNAYKLQQQMLQEEIIVLQAKQDNIEKDQIMAILAKKHILSIEEECFKVINPPAEANKHHSASHHLEASATGMMSQSSITTSKPNMGFANRSTLIAKLGNHDITNKDKHSKEDGSKSKGNALYGNSSNQTLNLKALGKTYRETVYNSAVDTVHKTRLYDVVPVCDLCYRFYTLLDHYREMKCMPCGQVHSGQNATSLSYGSLTGNIRADGRKSYKDKVGEINYLPQPAELDVDAANDDTMSNSAMLAKISASSPSRNAPAGPVAARGSRRQSVSHFHHEENNAKLIDVMLGGKAKLPSPKVQRQSSRDDMLNISALTINSGIADSEADGKQKYGRHDGKPSRRSSGSDSRKQKQQHQRSGSLRQKRDNESNQHDENNNNGNRNVADDDVASDICIKYEKPVRSLSGKRDAPVVSDGANGPADEGAPKANFSDKFRQRMAARPGVDSEINLPRRGRSSIIKKQTDPHSPGPGKGAVSPGKSSLPPPHRNTSVNQLGTLGESGEEEDGSEEDSDGDDEGITFEVHKTFARTFGNRVVEAEEQESEKEEEKSPEEPFKAMEQEQLPTTEMDKEEEVAGGRIILSQEEQLLRNQMLFLSPPGSQPTTPPRFASNVSSRRNSNENDPNFKLTAKSSAMARLREDNKKVVMHGVHVRGVAGGSGKIHTWAKLVANKTLGHSSADEEQQQVTTLSPTKKRAQEMLLSNMASDQQQHAVVRRLDRPHSAVELGRGKKAGHVSNPAGARYKQGLPAEQRIRGGITGNNNTHKPNIAPATASLKSRRVHSASALRPSSHSSSRNRNNTQQNQHKQAEQQNERQLKQQQEQLQRVLGASAKSAAAARDRKGVAEAAVRGADKGAQRPPVRENSLPQRQQLRHRDMHEQHIVDAKSEDHGDEELFYEDEEEAGDDADDFMDGFVPHQFTPAPMFQMVQTPVEDQYDDQQYDHHREANLRHKRPSRSHHRHLGEPTEEQVEGGQQHRHKPPLGGTTGSPNLRILPPNAVNYDQRVSMGEGGVAGVAVINGDAADHGDNFEDNNGAFPTNATQQTNISAITYTPAMSATTTGGVVYENGLVLDAPPIYE